MNRDHIIGKICVLCEKKYGMDEEELFCPSCGITGILDVEYDYHRVKKIFFEYLSTSKRNDMFRFSPLLPLDLDGIKPVVSVGPTPLFKAERLGKYLNFPNLYIKDDGRLPTSSFKDRASAVAVARARELSIDLICAASTGNAAASLAGLTAPEGLTSVIFVPSSAPPAKIAQLLTFGAKVFAVEGSYDDAFELSLAASKKFGWYSRSTAINPLLSEGKKTGALELLEQFGFDSPPDYIFVSVGDGCIIGGLAKGLKDLHEMGIIPKVPALVGVQAQGSKVIYEIWKSGTEKIIPVQPTTRADSISVAFPRDYIKAVRGVRATKGVMVTVSDDQIFNGGLMMGKMAGIFAEPAAAAAFAGFLKLKESGSISNKAKIAIYITGSGLKDVEGSSMAADKPISIAPDKSSLEKVKNSLNLQ
jgi:threonine synthase